MSAPVSAMMTPAPVLATPGMLISNSRIGAKGAITTSIRALMSSIAAVS
jgi:hypothetical protein